MGIVLLKHQKNLMNQFAVPRTSI